MTKIVDTQEIIRDVGAVVTAALKQHGIELSEIKVRVMPEEIRILVNLEEPESEVQD